MSVHNPAASSFSRYAQENLGPLAGYITGWTYCFGKSLLSPSPMGTAFGIYMGVWFPTVPHWIWVLSVVLIICAVNLMSVKVFGELEFWFSFFKVATIIIMIVAGFGIIIWGLATAGKPTGIHNLWSNGGFFSNGWLGNGNVVANGDVCLRWDRKLSGLPPVKRKILRNRYRVRLTPCRCVFWCSTSVRCSSLCLSTRGIRLALPVARSIADVPAYGHYLCRQHS